MEPNTYQLIGNRLIDEGPSHDRSGCLRPARSATAGSTRPATNPQPGPGGDGRRLRPGTPSRRRIVLLVRRRILVRLDSDYGVSAVRIRLQFRWGGVLLDLARGFRRAIAGGSVLRAARRDVADLRFDLSVVLAVGRHHIWLVHRLDDDHRADPDGRCGGHRDSGRATRDLVRFPDRWRIGRESGAVLAHRRTERDS